MMPAVFLEPRLDPCIVKILCLDRSARGVAAAARFVGESLPTLLSLAAFGFDGDRPGILGQDIYHGQQ